MTALLAGIGAVFEPSVLLCLGTGLVVGMLVGMFPGITATMAVALASGFTMTLEPVQGLAVLLTIYVAANFGDRIPSILINTPGTPASIATTFDGYPMAKNGEAGLALIVSALVSAVGILASMVLFASASVPLAQLALKFGPSEMFAVVILAMTIMISISSSSLTKGLLAGVIGLFIATVGRDPITGDARFTFGIRELNSGLDFIAVIIGLFGIAELFDQLLTHRDHKVQPISALGRWWPTRSEYKRIAKPTVISGIVGLIVGVIPGAGGDIAGLLGWDRAKSASKTRETFGKGNIEGVAASDTASSATLGGSLTTTMALGIPGDSVMAVMIGSMIIWGIQPGPSLFVNRPALVVTITTIMVLATLVTLGINLVRMPMMVKLLDMPKHYIWATILVFCIIGTYATTNNLFTVTVMLVFGVIGVILKRCSIPAGPIVLGLILGPLAEANLRRTLLIDGPAGLINKPISAVLLAFAVIAVVTAIATPILARRRQKAATVQSN
ncbi:tripartite tricarboxylate transporter permease [Chelativorans sp. SCAU2101]|uniref:Tripartite tricarboxylate transporter permease n=1 Tax=Chelativorans petroleitrophicus TaxID=2975484 RepID=A0A9X3AZM6_9HYPH|nr:tripartite tricarboxylate transporter permease [Chelativorans petroleitrophicus]MCT8990440.1 tripartite tricarboxylate transporter permease [Chelativorans petroleitrophicus]